MSTQIKDKPRFKRSGKSSIFRPTDVKPPSPCPYSPNDNCARELKETCGGCSIHEAIKAKRAKGQCPHCGGMIWNWKLEFNEKHSCG